MDEKYYKHLTGKKIHKPKPRAKPLPKATNKYLETDELLTQQVLEHSICVILNLNFEKINQI